MSKYKTLDSKLQSEKDNLKDARNSKSGFKQTMSAGVRGAGDTYGKIK